jgi:hypothetical protein
MSSEDYKNEENGDELRTALLDINLKRLGIKYTPRTAPISSSNLQLRSDIGGVSYEGWSEAQTSDIGGNKNVRQN